MAANGHVHIFCDSLLIVGANTGRESNTGRLVNPHHLEAATRPSPMLYGDATKLSRPGTPNILIIITLIMKIKILIVILIVLITLIILIILIRLILILILIIK